MCCCAPLVADDIEVLCPEIAQREAEACPWSMIMYICSGNWRGFLGGNAMEHAMFRSFFQCKICLCYATLYKGREFLEHDVTASLEEHNVLMRWL